MAKFKSMRKRVVSGIILIGVSVAAIIVKPLCFITVVFLTLLGLWEFFSMLEKKGVKLFKIFGLFLGGIIPLSIFFRFPVTREWQLFFILSGLFLLFLLELTRKENQETILSLSGTVFGVLYVSWCFSFIIRIRALEGGVYLLAFLITVVKVQDIGAYLVGTFLGRRPLIKRVSPKKSVEGAVGGVLLSILFAVLFRGFLKGVNLGQIVLLSFVLSVIGQLGDLFESLIKRDCGVKDSGRLISGMGGVLDVIDSLIFTAPVFYFYFTMLKNISFVHLIP